MGNDYFHPKKHRKEHEFYHEIDSVMAEAQAVIKHLKEAMDNYFFESTNRERKDDMRHVSKQKDSDKGLL